MESSYHLLLRSSLVTFPRILLINGYLVFMHMLANKNYKQRKETGLDLFSLLFFAVRFIGLFLNQLSFRNDLLNKDNFVPQFFFFFWGGVSIFFSLNKTFQFFIETKRKYSDYKIGNYSPLSPDSLGKNGRRWGSFSLKITRKRQGRGVYQFGMLSMMSCYIITKSYIQSGIYLDSIWNYIL